MSSMFAKKIALLALILSVLLNLGIEQVICTLDEPSSPQPEPESVPSEADPSSEAGIPTIPRSVQPDVPSSSYAGPSNPRATTVSDVPESSRQGAHGFNRETTQGAPFLERISSEDVDSRIAALHERGAGTSAGGDGIDAPLNSPEQYEPPNVILGIEFPLSDIPIEEDKFPPPGDDRDRVLAAMAPEERLKFVARIYEESMHEAIKKSTTIKKDGVVVPNCLGRFWLDFNIYFDSIMDFEGDIKEKTMEKYLKLKSKLIKTCLNTVSEKIREEWYKKNHTNLKVDDWLEMLHKEIIENKWYNLLFEGKLEEYLDIMDPEKNKVLDDALKQTLLDTEELNYANKMTAYQSGKEGSCVPAMDNLFEENESAVYYIIKDNFEAREVREFVEIGCDLETTSDEKPAATNEEGSAMEIDAQDQSEGAEGSRKGKEIKIESMDMEEQDNKTKDRKLLMTTLHLWALCRSLKRKKLPPIYYGSTRQQV